jgi:hypothetical protein
VCDVSNRENPTELSSDKFKMEVVDDETNKIKHKSS